ncbi:MAG: hypothetical protein R6U46_15080 [Marinilabilia sp.]
MAIDSQVYGKIRDLLGVDFQEYDSEILPRMLEIVTSLRFTGGYSGIGELKELFIELEKNKGAQVSEAAARALLVEMTKPDYWTPSCRVPDSVRKEVSRSRERVIKEATEKPAGHYSPFHDAFLKDFSILRGKSMPVNTGIVDTKTVLWRRPMVVGPLKQRFMFMFLLLRPPAGTHYFFQHHTHTSMLKDFNQKGRLGTYNLVCDLLEINTNYKGFVSASWYNDPALESISPRLTYLAQDPLRGGAYRFYVGEDSSGSALAKSKTRNELYQKRQYIPRVYMVVWHRAEMLKWRESRK